MLESQIDFKTNKVHYMNTLEHITPFCGFNRQSDRVDLFMIVL